jgi:hypothetical protein
LGISCIGLGGRRYIRFSYKIILLSPCSSLLDPNFNVGEKAVLRSILVAADVSLIKYLLVLGIPYPFRHGHEPTLSLGQLSSRDGSATTLHCYPLN